MPVRVRPRALHPNTHHTPQSDMNRHNYDMKQ